MNKISFIYALRFTFFIVINGFVLMTCLAQPIDSIQMVVEGRFINRADQKIYFVKGHEDLRNQYQTFEVKDGLFSHTLSAFKGEALQLILGEEFEQGAFRPIIVFADSSHLNIEINEQNEAHLHQIHGGALNKNYHQYLIQLQKRKESLLEPLMVQMQKLNELGQYHSPAFMELAQSLSNKTQDEKLPIYAKMDSLQQLEKDLTKEALALRKAFQEKEWEMMTWKYDDFVKNDLSAVSLYLMLQDIRFHKDEAKLVNKMAQYFPEYAAVLEGHPYVEWIRRELHGALGLKVGQTLTSFEAPDLEGEVKALYPLLSTNKVTLLNLWGSWCGPCIAKSRTMVPLLADYKSKGFGIIGVAREFKTTKNLEDRLKQEDFDWINLVDLDDERKIWSQFGISNAAGMMILVDQKGVILAIDPDAQQVKAILTQTFAGN
jgi:thiol-disulfide isomerase/thioredoxin